ncbi:MAG: rod shape-determining protein MreD, partial [Paracoccaceae bacterium]
YMLIAALLLFARLLPLNTVPPDWPSPSPLDWPGPDLLLCLTCAWMLRRPDYVPALLIVVVFLVEDMFSLRPPGLWPAIVVIGTEFLRSREGQYRDMPLTVEWAVVAGAMLAMMLANHLALAIFLVPQPATGFSVVQMLATMVAYPLVALFSRHVAGVQRPSPAEIDAWGQHR